MGVSWQSYWWPHTLGSGRVGLLVLCTLSTINMGDKQQVSLEEGLAGTGLPQPRASSRCRAPTATAIAVLGANAASVSCHPCGGLM